MVELHYLKYTYSLSDEAVVGGWVENPYWQYFCGGIFFEHRFPIDPSSMTRFRERLKKAGLEELLAETIRTGLRGRRIPARARRHFASKAVMHTPSSSRGLASRPRV